ncbi:SulP family inorganic anion transporter [Variovorax sp. VNK109]|uniref:SulP family inorganic anion transporter n=1 Tax=Variovorax sp. VNK109 TaxID=3400919 RepID=UPI003C0522A8
MSPLSRWLPFLAWPRPTWPLMRGELAAGLTVGMVIVPQSVAYATLAGMPLETGIYASFLPALVALIWSASPRLSVGPTALSSILVGASLTGLADPAGGQWVALAVWLALLSGVMQLILGIGRFGWIVNLVSSPVLMGFTQAATVLIILSQVPALIGSDLPMSRWLASPHLDWYAFAFGVVSLAVLVAGKRWLPRVPMMMLVLAGAAILSKLTGFHANGGPVVGNLPTGLPSLYLPGLIDLQTLGVLIVPAMVIALVSFLEVASSAKVENQQKHQGWNENQDLIAQGLAKISSGLIGSFPTSSSFSRSALNLYAGAQTGWAALVTVVLVLLVMLWFTPLLFHVPLAVLAAVVIAAVSSLIKPRAFVQVWKVSRVEAATALVTVAVTLVTAPRIYWGVAAGVLMGLAHFLYQRLHPRIIEAGLHPDGSLRDRHLWQLPPLAPDTYALRMDAELDFAAASTLERNITEHLARNAHVRRVCLFAQPINRIDATGVEVFGQMRRNLQGQGIELYISGIKLPVESALQRAGELPQNGQAWPLLHLYRTDAETLSVLAATPAST